MLAQSLIQTPLGPMLLVHGDGALQLAEFHDNPTKAARYPGADTASPAPAWLADAFAAYFSGNLHALHSLPTRVSGSDFDKRVWAELRNIPPGQTRSYGDIARALGGVATGKGGLARAVGLASGRNPLAIVTPCHRVIGADGSLTGYAGGLAAKRWLLQHEGWRPAQEKLL
ncbi:MAG: methylated-DNA--[protein]-cysteine S-methyltransferase [Sphingomonadaceae bacterium]